MIRAELLKLTTVRPLKITAWIGLGGLIFTHVLAITLLPMAGTLAEQASAQAPEGTEIPSELPGLALSPAATQLSALSPFGPAQVGSLGISLVCVLIIGVLAGAMDNRFGGMVQAALAQPRRERIIAAKAASLGLAGLVIGAGYGLVSLIAMLLSLPVLGQQLAIGPAEMISSLLLGMLTVPLIVLMAMGAGLLLRSQVLGLIVVLSAIVVESGALQLAQLFTGSVPAWMHFLPYSLSLAATNAGTGGLPPLAGLAGLIAWTAVILAGAALALRRRDI